MKKRIFILTLIVVLASASASFAMAESFSDVTEGKWFYDSVMKMTEQEIFKGYPDGSFRPDNAVAYSEFIKMFVVTVTGEDVGNSTSGHWAKNYYDKGIELGLYTEYDIKESDLGDDIPRKLMAFIVSNHFYGTKIENYNLIEESIIDLEKGKPYQHEIIKSYGMGILTGYEDGSFQPEGTLTRAESATVINRILNENERQAPEFEVPEKTVGSDDYWKKDKQYDEIVEWIADNQRKTVWGQESSLEDGKIYFIYSDGTKWTADNTNFPKLHEYVYFTLKTYYNYAIENDMGLSIGASEELNEITIGLRQNTRTTNDLFYFGFEGTPEYLDEIWAEAGVTDYVTPYVFFNQGCYFTDADVDKIGVDLLLQKERIGNQELVKLNRNIFKEVYGEETGAKIADYTIKIYKDTFDVENKKMVDLPNPKVTIDGIDIYFNDDSSYRAFYMDKPNQ